jgi:hypothetical protein
VTQENTLRNLYWGVRWGLTFAGVYCAWALLLLLFGGEEAFRKQGITFVEAFGSYIASGVFGGAVVGALRPLLERSWGAPIVGIVAAIPIGFAFDLATAGARWASTTSLITIAIFSVTLGAMGGLMLREVISRKKE